MRFTCKTVLLVAIPTAVVAAMAVGCTRETPGVAVAPAGAMALSDEDQVRDLVDQFEQAWNAKEFDTLRQLMCAEMRAEGDFSESSLREVRAEAGRLDLAITSIDIDGDNASTVIENGGEDPDDITFLREDGDWKWCDF